MDHQQQQQQPHAAHGYHQPEMHQSFAQGSNVHSQKWESSLFDCSPAVSCLLGCFLPCMLFGRTTDRMRDPSMQSASDFNGECALWCGIQCVTGCGFIYTMLKRGEIRERYGIEGSGFKDCCVTYWCGCCALIQQDNEVKKRSASGPITQGYQSQKQGMQMPHPASGHEQPQYHQQQQAMASPPVGHPTPVGQGPGGAHVYAQQSGYTGGEGMAAPGGAYHPQGDQITQQGPPGYHGGNEKSATAHNQY